MAASFHHRDTEGHKGRTQKSSRHQPIRSDLRFLLKCAPDDHQDHLRLLLSEIPSDSNVCPGCDLQLDDSATRRLDMQKSSPTRPPSFDSIDNARFVLGTILPERYRIVGPLGKGGMGEVYRADDLKPGQPVALKFLPDHLMSDGRGGGPLSARSARGPPGQP